MNRNPKAVMEEEAVKLITTVTDIEVEEENFEICERFVLSNLFYHKFLDPDETKVKARLAGLGEKFTIHAQSEKAARLRQLVEEFNKGEVWQEEHYQFDIRYRLISLLLHLAESPVNQQYSPEDVSPETQEEQVDWRAILREGEVEQGRLGDEESLSDWSETEEEEEEVKTEIRGSKVDIQFDEEELDKNDLNSSVERISASENWLREKVQQSYWSDERVQCVVTSPHLGANLAKEVERVLVEGGKLGVETLKLSEYRVIRELLWMLRCPVESPMFHLDSPSEKFCLNKLVTIPSLTEGALRGLLKEVLAAINDVHCINKFQKQVEVEWKDVPSTIEAYCSGLSIFFNTFSSDLMKIETDVKDQDDIHTLFTVLDKLKPWFRKLTQLRSIHEQAVSNMETKDNWMKAIKLLSVLSNALSWTVEPSLLPSLLDLFLRSLRPYIHIIHVWLTEGRLEDWNNEFIFYKAEAPDEECEDFWEKLFLQRDYKKKLAEENIVPLPLLEGISRKIFVSGQSIEILAKLDQDIEVDKNSEQFSTDMFTDFLQNIERSLRKCPVEASRIEEVLTHDLPPGLQATVDFAGDPYLALAMEDIFKKICLKDDVQHESVSDLLLPHIQLDPLLDLRPLLSRCLSPSIEHHYSRSCSTLVRLFRQDLMLENVLSRARKVFFMEAGDLMHDFCVQMFSQLDHSTDQELVDSSSLTLLLQDCLASTHPSWSDQFSVTWDQDQTNTSPVPSLAGLTLHLAVPWPLSVLLTKNNLATYNKVFVFLTGVKRALWALQSVRLSRLAVLEEQLEADELGSKSLLAEDISLPLGCKTHRLQLLRSWLLYFTTTVHGYFMSRVVHTTELELKEELNKAKDLDEIMSVHQAYLDRIYDRCFLHPSASMLHEAVSLVLTTGLELHQLVTQDLVLHTRTLTMWEERYSKCHKFLASTLQAMTAKWKLPHLEGLAVALRHSCPA